MINLTPRDRLQYALKVQRLHDVLVLKDDIHLQYKYKNINRATTQAASFQDKIIDAVIEDAVSGTSDPINSSNIKNGVENIIDSNLKNDAKRISYGIPEKAVNAAVSNISNRYQFILGNRIREEIPNLQGKIEDYINTKNLGNLSEAELTQKLKAEYGEHAQKRIQNIIRDSFHTNECNLSWVKAVYDGYSYKIWNNGRTKRTRVWHKAKFIQSVPIDETFDIFGSYPARMMYPGDLNGGAENVANCKCWLSYTNNKPSDLRGTGKKTTTKSTKSNKSKTNNGLINKVKNAVKKPLNKIKSRISRNSKPETKTRINSKLELKRNNFIADPYIQKSNYFGTRNTSETPFTFNEKEVHQKLKDILPKEFSDESIDYLLSILKQHGNSKVEHGQIFNIKTGKPTSIEFEGGKNWVEIEPSELIKSFEDMTPKESEDYLKNPRKYIKYVRTMGDDLAMQHHHTPGGLYAPSGRDLFSLMSNTWTEYSFALSKKEIWIMKTHGSFDTDIREEICKRLKEFAESAESYANSRGFDKNSSKWFDALNKSYSRDVEKYINHMVPYNINVYKVEL